MTKYEAIKEAVENLDMYELVRIHNSYCEATNNGDNYIYLIDEFDEIMSDQEPWEVARSVYYGGFCPAHSFFWFDGYGNLASSDFPQDNIFAEDIADYIERTGDALDNDKIQEVLDEYDAIERRASDEEKSDEI